MFSFSFDAKSKIWLQNDIVQILYANTEIFGGVFRKYVIAEGALTPQIILKFHLNSFFYITLNLKTSNTL